LQFGCFRVNENTAPGGQEFVNATCASVFFLKESTQSYSCFAALRSQSLAQLALTKFSPAWRYASRERKRKMSEEKKYKWDLRKGAVSGTYTRLALEFLEVKKISEPMAYWPTPRIKDYIIENLPENFEGGLRGISNVLSRMADQELLDVIRSENPKKWYKFPNRYRLSSQGDQWWRAHKDEGWGYGEAWEDPEEKEKRLKEWLALPQSKLQEAVESGKKIRIRFPCQKNVWRDFCLMASAGQIEVVVEKKRTE
jgi:hypothetical protein